MSVGPLNKRPPESPGPKPPQPKNKKGNLVGNTQTDSRVRSGGMTKSR